MNEPELTALLARAAGGESAAFAELVARHHLQVYRWAVVAADDPDEAEDLAQRVWIRVHRSLAGYRGTSRFTTWLYRIVFNLAAEGYRLRERRGRALAARPAAPEEAVTETRETIDAARLAGIVRGYLAGLPLRQRTVLAMADFEGLAIGEIAERLDLEEVTVRTNLFKARRAVRERLLREEPRLTEEYRHG